MHALAPGAARYALALLLVLSLLAAVLVPGQQVASDRTRELQSAQGAANVEDQGDMALYRRVAARVAQGENYYAAATDENRRANYPTKPFVTIRLPTLTLLTVWLGESGMRMGLIALLLANAALLPMALARGGQALGVGAATLAGGAAVMAADAYLMHEMWAGALLTLSFALWRAHRWWPAIIPAVLALTIRETALPFVLLWGAFATYRGNWREALAIAMVVVGFGFGIVDHASAVSGAWLAGDKSGQGWAGLLGPAPFLQGVHMLTVLVVLPAWVAGPVAVLALFGFAARGGRAGWFALLYAIGVMAMLALFARAENWYWTALVLPLLLAGLALAPMGLADLIAPLRAAHGSGRNRDDG